MTGPAELCRFLSSCLWYQLLRHMHAHYTYIYIVFVPSSWVPIQRSFTWHSYLPPVFCWHVRTNSSYMLRTFPDFLSPRD